MNDDDLFAEAFGPIETADEITELTTQATDRKQPNAKGESDGEGSDSR